jgi:3-demethoxyubiquinol 3-hydroxylase
MRLFSPIDKLISHFDNYLKMLPAKSSVIHDNDLSDLDKKLSVKILRVDHCGEVCAQALYKSQAMFAEDWNIKQALQQSATEEIHHLNWCKTRLAELNGKTSYLAPTFGLGAFFIGSIFGIAGDKWSLGFLAETEHQVTKHLSSQLEKLSLRDRKTRLILEQMRIDELNHATTAENNGGVPLPKSIKFIMQGCAKIMTTATQYI